jgi:cysteine desulfurase
MTTEPMTQEKLMQELVYLDYAATTPVDPRVAEIMTRYLGVDGDFANPSAVHIAGRRAADAVDRAARQLAGLLRCKSGELVWTSGATESNNLAITGAARYREHRGKHLITMPTEHKAVTNVFQALEKQGYEVTWLNSDERGRLHIGEFEAALRDDTQLVSVMHVNNETGVLQNIEAIGALCRERDILFHVDAAQSIGKLPIDLSAMPVDLVSMTAHKIYGPKGIGALYIADRPGCNIDPILFGGGQPNRIRPGTLPVHLIAAFGLAADIAVGAMEADLEQLQSLHDQLWAGLSAVSGIRRNGTANHAFPGILNVSVEDIEGESLLLALEPLCVATGSACNSQNQEPSYVLRALGRSAAEAQSAIRFSFGRMSTESDIRIAVQKFRDAVDKLRRMAPTDASEAA